MVAAVIVVRVVQWCAQVLVLRLSVGSRKPQFAAGCCAAAVNVSRSDPQPLDHSPSVLSVWSRGYPLTTHATFYVLASLHAVTFSPEWTTASHLGLGPPRCCVRPYAGRPDSVERPTRCNMGTSRVVRHGSPNQTSSPPPSVKRVASPSLFTQRDTEDLFISLKAVSNCRVRPSSVQPPTEFLKLCHSCFLKCKSGQHPHLFRIVSYP